VNTRNRGADVSANARDSAGTDKLVAYILAQNGIGSLLKHTCDRGANQTSSNSGGNSNSTSAISWAELSGVELMATPTAVDIKRATDLQTMRGGVRGLPAVGVSTDHSRSVVQKRGRKLWHLWSSIKPVLVDWWQDGDKQTEALGTSREAERKAAVKAAQKVLSS
jgi:hypothetical protein